MLLDGVRLVQRDGRWHAVDAAGEALPLVRGDHWPLVAFGGGGEVALAGEWYGRALAPLTVAAGGRVVTL